MELIIVLAIVIVVFGAGRLADVGGALGRSIREFRGAASADPAVVRTCPACGVAAPPGGQFCGSCGQRLAE
jgi:TatA/E family protein of Tat protein translocase